MTLIIWTIELVKWIGSLYGLFCLLFNLFIKTNLTGTHILLIGFMIIYQLVPINIQGFYILREANLWSKYKKY